MPDEPGTVLEELDESGQNVAAPVTAAAPAAGKPPPPAEGDEDDDPGLHAVDQGGRKVVPLEYAATQRQKKAEAKARVTALEAELAQLKPWQTFGQQARPIIEALQKRPELWAALQSGKVPAAKVEPADAADEELVTFAKSLDLYDRSGEPDLGRAKTINAIIEKTAKKLVAAEVGPLAATTARDRSAANFQRMAAYKAPSGRAIDPAALKAVWSLVPPEVSQDEQVAQVLLMATAGYQSLFGKEPVKVEPVEDEPLVVEASGGRGSALRLTDLQNKAAKDLGVSSADFAKGIKTVIDQGGVLE